MGGVLGRLAVQARVGRQLLDLLFLGFWVLGGVGGLVSGLCVGGGVDAACDHRTLHHYIKIQHNMKSHNHPPTYLVVEPVPRLGGARLAGEGADGVLGAAHGVEAGALLPLAHLAGEEGQDLVGFGMVGWLIGFVGGMWEE